MVAYLVAAVVVVALGGVAVAAAWLRRQLRIITVEGDSMLPTLAPGDQVLVRRVPVARVATGDIVVLSPPFRGQAWRGTWLIKRAVAVPGDPVPASVAPAVGVEPGSPVRDGALVAIGDNREASGDSRTFGYVHAEDLFGVMLRPFRLGSREAAPQGDSRVRD